MEQRSDAWHQARAGKINASEAGALLGLSPYISANAARKRWIEEAQGIRREFDSADMKRGRDMEPAILNEVEAEYDDIVQQDGGRIWNEIFRASADGWMDIVPDGRFIVEAKAPRKFFKPIERLDYLLQMLIQCYAYDADYAVLAQGVQVEGKLESRSEAFTRDQLTELVTDKVGQDPLIKLTTLHAELLAVAESGEDGTIQTDEWNDAQTAYLAAKQAADQAKQVLDDAKQQLLKSCRNKPVVGSRLQVVEQTRQGSINTKALTKAHPEIDLDEFRGDPLTYLTIREVKK